MSHSVARSARPSRWFFHEAPPEYRELVRRMVSAANTWLSQQSGDVYLEFQAFPDRDFSGDFNEINIQLFGRNEQTREMLRVMDKATEHEATLMMARIAIDILEYGED